MGSNSSLPKLSSNIDLIQICSEHSMSINCLAFNEKNLILASGSDDGIICIWQLNLLDLSNIICTHRLHNHQGYITELIFHNDYLISSSSDGTIRKWNFNTGKCEYVFEGHKDVVRKIICVNDYIVSGSQDKTAICWNFHTGAILNTFKGHTRLVNAVTYFGTVANIFRNDNNSEMFSTARHFERVYTGSADRTAKSWSLRTSKCIVTFEGHTQPITAIETFKDGEILLTASIDNTIRSWFTESGVQQFVFVGHKGTIVSMHINNKMLYTGSIDHTARSWSIETGKQIRVFSKHTRSVNYVRNHEGMVITACSDGCVRLFDEKTGELLKKLIHPNQESCVMFKIYGDYLFSASNDGKIYIWRYFNPEIMRRNENE
ncbi:f-box and wd40 domain protein, putative [Schistosoma mansoni]|uniref:F-box and wd40 domain protein, putative n=1 Tax=Schistosoma mansoni TaxID=6183 RepID=G4LUT6_SCHMA|nr:f-box and wd40 domain protein, putative [Schistosoma mansoni]|eukprot:XP_018645038.1 f-box and wd40 domain protein, putative [Schistosoma mansoni]